MHLYYYISHVKEIHGVRWFSFYAALNAVHQCWDAICMSMEEVAAKDPTAKGILKRITTVQFLGVTAMLMDIIPTMTSINLLFQRRDLDLSIIYPTLDAAVGNLKKLETEQGNFLSQFMVEIGDKCRNYKGVQITDTLQLRASVTKNRVEFCKSLQKQLERRFPDTSVDLIKAFSILGMKGLKMIHSEEQDTWGNDKINLLIEHYGHGRADLPAYI